MRISDWSSDVCSSDLEPPRQRARQLQLAQVHHRGHAADGGEVAVVAVAERRRRLAGDARADRVRDVATHLLGRRRHAGYGPAVLLHGGRSEEHTSELQSLMRNSYAVFCLKKKKKKQSHTSIN